MTEAEILKEEIGELEAVIDIADQCHASLLDIGSSNAQKFGLLIRELLSEVEYWKMDLKNLEEENDRKRTETF